MTRFIQAIIVTVIFAVAILSIVLVQTENPVTEISVRDVHSLRPDDSSYILIDVRTPREYSEERISHSTLIPLQELESRVHDLERYRSRTIVVYCRTGRRSTMAAEILKHYGFTVSNMTGGIVRWKSAGFSTITDNDT